MNLFDRSPNGAEISECGHYRYALWRTIVAAYPAAPVTFCFVMLNPSTADASVDDRTIRKVAHFVKQNQGTRFVVVNLYSYRATDPKELKGRLNLRGFEQYGHTRHALAAADVVVLAWGGDALSRDDERGMVDEARLSHPNLFYLGTTKHGSPRHPLYLKNITPLQIFTGDLTI